MDRTHIFISYCSFDRDWLVHVRTHLAVLERKELIDIWSDTNIEIGATWKIEIEVALSRARIAVLLITPAFLASRFIWKVEMPLIIEHSKRGMQVLPLIARPCAWRLETDLEQLQARPNGGRPLSSGSNYEIDLDLSKFTYELAAKIGRMTTNLMTQENERIEGYRTTARTLSVDGLAPGLGTGGAGCRASLSELLASQGTIAWEGDYLPTRARLRLTIQSLGAGRLAGTIEYIGEDTMTSVEGAIAVSPEELKIGDLWPDRNEWLRSPNRVALRFKEIALLKKGKRTPVLEGEYRAIASLEEMAGVWVSAAGQVVGSFRLKEIVDDKLEG
jgi:hypothetical protein